MEVLAQLLKDIPIPRLTKVKQKFKSSELQDVSQAVHQAIKEEGVLTRISQGDRVAIGVGSRGMADIEIITREVVEIVKSVGGKPFIGNGQSWRSNC